ncbi:MAG: SPFH domain-containing protein [Petrimonas sp.]|uniref:SPFH domain-containing protein n=1 Tax=Petrimonas sp. TaxID=2023866 RepID=UPI00095FE687|nr:SPFH domain-containing protein [Petrimonas sp.]MEA4950441.1 SPFH domain-containing protein [Petrimonas sp.]MEA5045993.1 SPFH domain-containing protein [Petrimonas sp.]MEA5063332.1 SPFH domain-containing protein [Petrimonas sp.]OJV37204.1 MAG: band 7 protein [Bacteroidia bacterium 43-41]
METKEFNFKGFRVNGFLMLFLLFLLLGGTIFCFFLGDAGIIAGCVLALIWFILLFGFVKLEPNEAVVMIFFGKYKGVLKETGFFWVNPFMSKKKLSMRARNLNVEPIKVNDKVGNPILIGLVLVWKLKDTYKAMFEIDAQTMAASNSTPDRHGAVTYSVSKQMDAFENFVAVQSDAALRQVAGQYAYDNNLVSDVEITLRSGGDEVNVDLLNELNNRLEMAGIEIVEARINYLAYAPEIAAVMLRRQQAEAIISAREKIVEGAVTMVKMALERIEDENIVTLDIDKKAAMVSNLLVVLCADESAQPVLNTGTLYQ